MRPSDEPKLPDRFDVERSVERSPLPTVCRDILLALCRRMQKGSTMIPPEHTPSLNSLARMTGWSRRHVQRGLDYLELLGIISRRRPSTYDAQVHHARTKYVVHYQSLVDLGPGSPKKARDAQSMGLGPVRRKPRAKQATDLGTASPEAEDTVAPDQISSDQPDHAVREVAFIRLHIADRTGHQLSEPEAYRIRALMLARPGAAGKNSLAYIRRVLALDRHPEKWLQPQLPETEEP